MRQGHSGGLLIVVSAPSGTGKTTLCRKLMEVEERARFSISVTSRAPRRGEVDGEDYIFLTEEEFLSQIDEGGFIEWARVHDHYYGTSRDFIEDNLKKGIYVILDIDVQGGLQIKEKYPDTILIFVMPPSLEELRNRLINRKQDTVEEIEKRINNSYDEVRRAPEYDYLIENKDIEVALSEMRAIITAEKCKVRKQRRI
ncbi:MAG: guanylate kinase [Elusimicrobia bacterium]|nr:guanylate kinase [Elusimicrobiota bacterium]